MRVDELDEFIEDGFLDKSLFVGCRRKFFEIYGVFYGFPEVADEFDVDLLFTAS